MAGTVVGFGEAADPMLGAVVGNYRIERKLGAGGTGSVYLARHPSIGRTAALKVLLPQYSNDPHQVGRFFNEAKAAAALTHPAFVDVFDCGKLPNGAAYLLMELVEGESLAARLQRVAPLPPDLAIELGRQLCVALAVAHERGIIHRDLKPANIFLAPDHELDGGERVRILDFGAAKLQGGQSAVRTATLAVMGTPAYMAPEQCRGAGAVDHRADIYSVGCVLYEMLTARPPFDLPGPGELLAAHLYTPVTAPRTLNPEITPALEAVVLRALAKPPQDRFADMTAFAAALVAARTDPTVAAGPPPQAPPPQIAPPPRLAPPPHAAARHPPDAAAPQAGGNAGARPLRRASPRVRAAAPTGRTSLAPLALLGAAIVVVVSAGAYLAYRALDRPTPAVATSPEPPPTAPNPPPITNAPASPPAIPTPPTAPTTATAPAKPTTPTTTPAAPTITPAAAPSSTPKSAAVATPPSARALSAAAPPGQRGGRGGGAREVAEGRRALAAGAEDRALRAFRRALRAGVTGAERSFAEAQVIALGRRFGEVDVGADVAGATVLLDGRTIGATPLPEPLLLAPGRHTITLQQGRTRQDHVLDVEPGQKHFVRFRR